MRRLALPLAALVAVVGCSPSTPTATTTPTPTPSILSVEPERQVGVQLFQWNWPSVGRECTEVLGPNQFAFVLLSPAQEHIVGEQWWTSYQPVSYQLESKLGTRDEFEEMVSTCHEAGVKVIADAVINHMAGIDGGTGVAGTEFTHYEYPGLYGPDDFHTCDTPGGDIVNYVDQQEVQECELSNLADLRTGEPEVQSTIVSYLDDLTSLGVDGFRIDAAKHMHHRDVQEIVDQLSGDPIIISEVIRASSEPIQPEDYLEIGSVFAFQVAKDLAGLVPGGALHRALDLKDGQVPSEQAYTFVTNHDTERNRQTLSYKDADKYRVANYLLLAQPYGTPVLYSGYAFTDRDEGAPQTDGGVDDVECATPSDDPAPGDWLCQHRTDAGMAEWVAVVGDEPIGDLWREGYAIGFDRGDRGLIVINGNSTLDVSPELTTSLPDGAYCNAADLPPSGAEDRCADGEFIVADGKVTVPVSPMSAVALHVNLRSA
ncbi:alpha-amylase [Tessaracoccus flavus]|uniref:Alpha-amylase n=1 Tax=Tessaracoccus flavus TaxID=1610493 RepID=A0A1Q2CHE6_9ACTN|nr:alpha-amylase family protein [Tessaracoccus flavus]AQP45531.1 hypothetical protein RPIT_12550 [Tessaracoccus flavus]